LEKLATDPAEGLSSAEAQACLEKYGPNLLQEGPPKGPWPILREQFTGALVLLLAAAAVSFLLGEYKDGLAILVIVVLNALFGFIQEYRAEKAMEALKKFSVPRAKVLREGRIQEISAQELVPGDVFFLEAGDVVPADGRLLEAANLRLLEVILTGESVPVDKDPSAIIPARHL